MYKIILLLTLAVAVNSKSVSVGQVYEYDGVKKVYETTIEANALPLLKREKYVSFESAPGEVVIKGMAIRDLDEPAKAEPSIRLGGIGFSSTEIKLKSARGSGFKFLIQIYA